MDIIIHGDKLKITSAMNDYIEEKLEKLDKYLENSDNVRANVIVKVKNHEQKVEITIPLKSFILRSEEAKEDFYAAESHFPHDAFEALSWLVEGFPIEEILELMDCNDDSTDDSLSAALDRPESLKNCFFFTHWFYFYSFSL